MNIVLWGAPAPARARRPLRLVRDFGVAHISTGDLLRAAVKGGMSWESKLRSTWMPASSFRPARYRFG